MSNIKTDLYLNHPGFLQYVKLKKRVSLSLTFITLFIYGLYVLGMCFTPDVLSMPMAQDSAVTLGMVMAIVIILSGVILSGFYTYWANNTLDSLKNAILKEFENE